MEKITLKYENESLDIIINKSKYIIGDNYKLKFDYIQAIRNHFNKTSQTEYNEQFQNRRCVYIDDKVADVRKWNLIEINSFFDLNSDIKLGTKSVLLKYYESMLKDIEYSDLVTTINGLLNDLNETFINNDNEFENLDIALNNNIQLINTKSILKMLEVTLIKNEMEANCYDLKYEELINIQIQIAYKIAFNNQDKMYIVMLDINEVTKEISKIIKKLDLDNLFVLIFTNKIKCLDTIQLDQVAYCNTSCIDLINEEHLYNKIILDLPFNIGIKELQEEILEYVKGNLTDKNCKIVDKI